MFTITQTVTPSKTDPEGRLKLFSALQLMQDCSEMWKNSEPAFLYYLLENKAAQLLNFRHVDIVRVPELGEELVCSTSVFGAQGPFGYRNTIIKDARGLTCYRSWAIGAFVSAETGRLLRLPQEVIDKMRIDPKLPMDYSSRKITLPEARETPLAPIPVQRNDIDYNRHVNNAHYVRMALECLPEDWEYTTLRVEYKRPVAPGAIIQPSLMLGLSSACVLLRVEDTVCCVVEFSRG